MFFALPGCAGGMGPIWCRNNLVAFSVGGDMYDKPGEQKRGEKQLGK